MGEVLTVENLNMQFDDQTVFKKLNFKIKKGLLFFFF